MFGLNIDPNNPRGNPDVAELQKLGVEMVRYTYYDLSGGNQLDPARARFYEQKAQAYHEAGIGSLIILTYDTYPHRPAPNAPDAEWDKYLERFAKRSGQIADLLSRWQPTFQIWNEPDHPVQGNYVPALREEIFGRMLDRTYKAIKSVTPRATVMTAGLAMGDPSWLTRVIESMGGQLPADMIVAFHPYGQRPEPTWPRPDWGFSYVGNLLNNYYRAGQRHPMWITEMGVKLDEIDHDPNKAAEFLRRYYRTITTHYENKVQQVFWFCYSDGMVEPFGLIDKAGNRKPMYQAFREAATEHIQRLPEPTPVPGPIPSIVPPPPPEPEPVTPPAEIVDGTEFMRQDVADLKRQQTELRDQMQQLQSQITRLERLLQQLSSQPGTPTPEPAESVIQEITELKRQNAELQSQMTRFQAELRQLSAQQTWLQNQLQQRPVQPPVGPIPVTPPPPPGTGVIPEPSIQDISQQLKRHPTRRFPTRSLDQIRRVIVHHTAIPARIGAEQIATYGVDKKGWAGIRYHYFITDQGQIQQTNDLTTLSDHAGPYSEDAIGIGFAGDFTEAIPTTAQMEAGAQLIAWLLQRFGLTTEAVVGYKALVNTQSPGLQWDAGARWGDQLKQKIQAYLATTV